MVVQDGAQLLELMRGYQVPCILAAAVDLDLFEHVAGEPRTAAEVAAAAGCDLRGTTIVLDALAAVHLLNKQDERYVLPAALAPLLVEKSEHNVLAMLRHQANCLRRWSRLPWTVRSGAPDAPGASIRGEEADQASFIEAMHVISREIADPLIQEIHPGGVRCVLDLGGASGSWTMAWLKAEPAARGIIFDLPHVIPMARARLADTPFAQRIELVPGDFYSDDLPTGADVVWVSAIIHQNSPEQNQALYRRIAAALEPGGWIYIRDIVLEPSRTAPVAGALFAVNMLAATAGGNSYSWTDIQESLQVAGFEHVERIRRDEGMHSIVRTGWAGCIGPIRTNRTNRTNRTYESHKSHKSHYRLLRPTAPTAHDHRANAGCPEQRPQDKGRWFRNRCGTTDGARSRWNALDVRGCQQSLGRLGIEQRSGDARPRDRVDGHVTRVQFGHEGGCRPAALHEIERKVEAEPLVAPTRGFDLVSIADDAERLVHAPTREHVVREIQSGQQGVVSDIECPLTDELSRISGRQILHRECDRVESGVREGGPGPG